MGRRRAAAIAVACGSVGGCLYLSVMLGTPGALILVYMTQLPLFLAGLWLGAGPAALAGLTGSLVLLAASNLLGAALFAAVNAAPAVLLVRPARLAGPRSAGTPVAFPPGLLAATWRGT